MWLFERVLLLLLHLSRFVEQRRILILTRCRVFHSSYVRARRTNTKCQHVSCVHRTSSSQVATHLNKHRSFGYILLCTAAMPDPKNLQQLPTLGDWEEGNRTAAIKWLGRRTFIHHHHRRLHKCARKYRSWTLIQAKCVELRRSLVLLCGFTPARQPATTTSSGAALALATKAAGGSMVMLGRSVDGGYNKQLSFVSRMNSNCKSEVFHPPTHSGMVPQVQQHIYRGMDGRRWWKTGQHRGFCCTG